MIRELLSIVRSLFAPLTWPRIVLVALLTLPSLLTLVLSILFVESRTGQFFYYPSIERRISLLRQLQELSGAGIASNPDLGAPYRQLLSDVAARPADLGLGFALSADDLLKFVLGSSIGIVLVLVGFNTRSKGERGWRGYVLGGFSYAIVTGTASLFLPTFVNGWLTGLAFTAAQTAFWLFIAAVGSRTGRKKATA
jgi:hypothetical protein